jgi:hypothetical protein
LICVALRQLAILLADFQIIEISGAVLGFRSRRCPGSPESPLLAFWGGMSRDDGDYGDLFRDFAQDSPRFNLAFTISRYNSGIDSRNAIEPPFAVSKRGGQGK